MTEQTMSEVYQSLIVLQDLDYEIGRARQKVTEFDPLLEELETPLTALEQELAAARASLDRMQTEIRRLERAAEEKRDRLKKYEERLMRVRDAREEGAARAELDLIQRALDADEAEQIQLMDQSKRAALKIDELEAKAGKAREELEPKRQELMAQRSSAEADLQALLEKRENQTIRLDTSARQLYEKVRGGRTKKVVAALTADGACGHCFSMVPIQRQTEIRRGQSLVRCEACGVILYPEE